MDDKLYFKVLSEKYQDIVKVLVKKQYKCFVPPSKYISQTMLIKAFYENHIFFQSDYESSLFVSLTGKVIQQNPTEEFFSTYIGFKKYMKFNVSGKVAREIPFPGVDHFPIIQAINIDNVIDENCYNPPNSSMKESTIKREVLTKYDTKDEYLSFYKQYLANNNDFKEVDTLLNSTIKKLMNDYILIKNHIPTYSMYFQEGFVPVKDIIAQKLEKFKLDELFPYIIVELAESVIFDKMQPFIMKNFKAFFKEEELIFKRKLKDSEFDFGVYKMDRIFNSCKFEQSIKEFNKISNYDTPFEKLKVIENVHHILEKEAKACYDKKVGKTDVFIATGDNLIPIWTYIVIKCDVPFLLSEAISLQNFRIKPSNLDNEADYHMAHMIGSVERLKSENQIFSISTTPFIINTNVVDQTFNPDTDFSFSLGNNPFARMNTSIIKNDDDKDFKDSDGKKYNVSSFKSMFV